MGNSHSKFEQKFYPSPEQNAIQYSKILFHENQFKTTRAGKEKTITTIQA